MKLLPRLLLVAAGLLAAGLALAGILATDMHWAARAVAVLLGGLAATGHLALALDRR